MTSGNNRPSKFTIMGNQKQFKRNFNNVDWKILPITIAIQSFI